MTARLDGIGPSGHDAVLLDLDGTVYRGGELVPGADEAIRMIHEHGSAVRYVTNNASRSKDDFAGQLVELGLDAAPDEVSTSPEAAAEVLAAQLAGGSGVFVLGSAALGAAVRNVGLVPVRSAGECPAAVVQGLSTDITWADLAEAALVLHQDALWVATNMDATLPTERGQLPGNGSLVAALVAASGREPLVAGKPERPLLDKAVSSAGACAPLFIGDRLDTDIAGATRADMSAMLVLSGVSRPQDVLAAPAEQRPDYLAADLRALCAPLVTTRVDAQPGWRCEVTDGKLWLASATTGQPAGAVAALRSLCMAWWQTGGGPVEVCGVDEPAELALAELGLT